MGTKGVSLENTSLCVSCSCYIMSRVYRLTAEFLLVPLGTKSPTHGVIMMDHGPQLGSLSHHQTIVLSHSLAEIFHRSSVGVSKWQIDQHYAQS